MCKRSKISILSIFVITLIMMTRFALVAHAVEYGSGPHKHDGKICTLTLSTEDDDLDIGILPVAPSLTFPRTKIYHDVPAQDIVLRANSNARSARAPPVLF